MLRKTNYTTLLQRSNSRAAWEVACPGEAGYSGSGCLFFLLPLLLRTATGSWQILCFYENTLILGRSATYLCSDVEFGSYLVVLLCGDWAEKAPTSLIDIAEFIGEWRSLGRSGHWKQTLEGCKLLLVSVSSFSSSSSSFFSLFPHPALAAFSAAHSCC